MIYWLIVVNNAVLMGFNGDLMVILIVMVCSGGINSGIYNEYIKGIVCI